MTIMVLEFRIPEGMKEDDLYGYFVRIVGPKIITYILSFVLLGTFWIGSHLQHHFLKQINRPLLWLNLLHMMIICLIPFTTTLLNEFTHSRFSIFLYSMNLTLAGLTHLWMWNYAVSKKFYKNNVTPELIIAIKKRILIPPLFYLLAFPASFLSWYISMILFIIPPIIHLLPGQMDRHIIDGQNDENLDNMTDMIG